jgi:hypothetical protein
MPIKELNGRIILNGELQQKQSEVIMAHFKPIHLHIPSFESLQEPPHNRVPDGDSNREPIEHRLFTMSSRSGILNPCRRK